MVTFLSALHRAHSSQAVIDFTHNRLAGDSLTVRTGMLHTKAHPCRFGRAPHIPLLFTPLISNR